MQQDHAPQESGIRLSGDSMTNLAQAMPEDTTEPLLENYHEDCPGCRLDRRKQSQSGVPFKEFLFVWLITLCSALPISSLFPFLYFMIRDLNIAKKEEDIGFYAGYVGSSFMLGRTFTALLWGIIADKYGRKPVIVFGVSSIMIFNFLFGLSINYWMAISTRFLLGSLNGLFGPIKAYAVEISPPEYQVAGLSLVATAWSIGLIIGPTIGGYLSQPADKFPNLFSKKSIFGRFPYFLPCLLISIFAAGVLVVSLWLPETLHNHKDMRKHGCYDPLQASENGSKSNVNTSKRNRKKDSYEENLLKNWPLMSSIIVYCAFSFHDMAYSEIFSLWAESDRQFGGLSFSSQDVGEVLVVSGFSITILQLFLFSSLIKLLGPIVSTRMAGVLTIPLLCTYPLYPKLCGAYVVVVVNLASILKNSFCIMYNIGLNILQNDAVGQHQRGAANGISMTLLAVFQTIAPAAAGSLFSWAQKRQSASFLPGDQLIFFALNVVGFLSVVLTLRPFLVPRN